MSSQNRLSVINSHLLNNFSFPVDNSLSVYRSRGLPIRAEVLYKFYYKFGFEVFEEFRTIFGRSLLLRTTPKNPLSIREKRDLVNLQLGELKKHYEISRSRHKTQLTYSSVPAQIFLNFDMSFCIKLGVNSFLFSDAIEYLGTEKHQRYADSAFCLNDLGCFALTELGHGSNVSQLGTTATYVHSSREFVINTPDSKCAKWWIGGAYQTANQSVVFANLVIDGVNHGPHGFLIDIRNRNTMTAHPGVIIGDCGPKFENDGIDNGFLIFNHYRVPYDSLLDGISKILDNGQFVSRIDKPSKRLTKMLSSLIRGRSAVVASSQGNLKNAVTIAVRYAAVRREVKAQAPILERRYVRTQLMTHLAEVFAINAAYEVIMADLHNITILIKRVEESEELTEFHAVLSAFKVVCSEWAFSGIHRCRVICGEMGYSQISRIGELLGKQDVNLTWEGDNNVLVQQATGFVVKQALKSLQGKPCTLSSLKTLNLDPDLFSKKRAGSDFLELSGLLDSVTHLFNVLAQKSLKSLQEATSVHSDYFDVWNFSQPGLQHLGRVFGIVQIVLHWERSIRQVKEQCSGSYLVLESLLKLFIIEKLNVYRPDLICSGYFNAEELLKLDETFVELCNLTAENSVKVIDAIGNEDYFHRSSLGYRDGQLYKNFVQETEQQNHWYSPSTKQ